MPTFPTEFLLSLSALFVVVDPLLVAPMFATMTQARSRFEIRAIAKRASIAGALLLLFFAAFGSLLFKVLGIRPDAFRAAGGLLLLLTALDMLRAKNAQRRCLAREIEDGGREDISIVPLATPMLAGPGAIATVMLMVGDAPEIARSAAVAAAIAVTFMASYVVLRAAPLLVRLFGASGMAMLQRVMALLLAAMSIQYIVEGARRLVL